MNLNLMLVASLIVASTGCMISDNDPQSESDPNQWERSFQVERSISGTEVVNGHLTGDIDLEGSSFQETLDTPAAVWNQAPVRFTVGDLSMFNTDEVIRGACTWSIVPRGSGTRIPFASGTPYDAYSNFPLATTFTTDALQGADRDDALAARASLHYDCAARTQFVTSTITLVGFTTAWRK